MDILQEIPDIPSSQGSLPPSHLSGLSSFTQNALPPGPNQHPPQNLTMPPSSQNLPSTASYIAPSSHIQPPMTDPLQSLKDVKVGLFFFVFFKVRL